MSNWDDIKNLGVEEGLPPHIVAAEPMQIAFLDGFYGEKDALNIVFHGGTSIRLLHGGYRYSEDLDFCIRPDLDASTLDALVKKAYGRARDLIFLYLGNCETELKKKEGRKKIATWWFNILPPGERRKYRVKIEFGTYPTYSKLPVPLIIKNKFMPRHPVVISTDPKELLADKLNAISDRPYTKERDFFDVWYLVKVLNSPLDVGLFRKKLTDYNAKDPKIILKKRLHELNGRALAENMANFLPLQYRTMLSQNNYQDVVDCCRDIMKKVLEKL